MMAEIEEGQNADQGKAREWLARAVKAPRDPVWTADGITADEWEPTSPVSGRLDAFEWKQPVSALAVKPEAVEQRAEGVEAKPPALPGS
jgi:HemY protein